MSAMRIAALYDIHGNLAALDAVLRDVERAAPDRIVIGGDVAAGPFPLETLDRLAALGERALYLYGNADRGMLASRAAPAPEGDLWAQRDRWAAGRLDDARRESMGRWPATLALEIRAIGYPGAEEFVQRYVVDPPGADDATRAFERRAGG
jgi:predicted phosphodiesterase